MLATSTCPLKGALAGSESFADMKSMFARITVSFFRSRGFAFVRFYDKHDAEVSPDGTWLELEMKTKMIFL